MAKPGLRQASLNEVSHEPAIHQRELELAGAGEVGAADGNAALVIEQLRNLRPRCPRAQQQDEGGTEYLIQTGWNSHDVKG